MGSSPTMLESWNFTQLTPNNQDFAIIVAVGPEGSSKLVAHIFSEKAEYQV